MPNLAGVRERLRASLWFVPSVMVAAAFALALAVTSIDRGREIAAAGRLFGGGVESARAILGVVASAVITFTALVFSITVVALQLSSQQFSPRVLRTFLRDTASKVALGMFIATFIYSLMLLRALGDFPGGLETPSLSMVVLLVLVLASVGMFIAYISHMAHSIRVSHIVAAVGDETRLLIDRHAALSSPEDPDRSPLEAPVSRILRVQAIGILTDLHHAGLVRMAREAQVAIVMLRAVGDFLAHGQALAEVRGEGEIDESRFHEQLALALERTMQQDVAFGVRQLIDIAEKALSPGINDPTTAVMALDQVHDLMRRLARQDPPPSEHVDDEGVVRLVTREWAWEGLVLLAFGEVRQFARASLQVTRRLAAILDDLLVVAPDDRRECLRIERRLLEAAAARNFEDAEDLAAATDPDSQGIGPAC